MLIGIQTYASSLVRTWYHPERLPKALIQVYPDASFAIYNGHSWELVHQNWVKLIELPKHKIRHSMALVDQMDLFICADSGISHLAEGAGVRHLTIYTTIPPYTRNKYYLYEFAIRPSVSCSPCFTLDGTCPLNRKRALESLSDRERKILELSEQQTNIHEASLQMDTTPEALIEERNAILQKIEGMSKIVPDCVQSIDTELIIQKVKEILDPSR